MKHINKKTGRNALAMMASTFLRVCVVSDLYFQLKTRDYIVILGSITLRVACRRNLTPGRDTARHPFTLTWFDTAFLELHTVHLALQWKYLRAKSSFQTGSFCLCLHGKIKSTFAVIYLLWPAIQVVFTIVDYDQYFNRLFILGPFNFPQEVKTNFYKIKTLTSLTFSLAPFQ